MPKPQGMFQLVIINVCPRPATSLPHKPLQAFKCLGLWGSLGRLSIRNSLSQLREVCKELEAGADQWLDVLLAVCAPLQTALRLLVDAGWTLAGLWPLHVVFPRGGLGFLTAWRWVPQRKFSRRKDPRCSVGRGLTRCAHIQREGV